MLSTTPRLDAVEKWIRSGRHGDIPWPQEEPERWPDPPGWRDVDVRLEAALMMAGGARAELPARTVLIGDKHIPVPPGGPAKFKHGKRRKPPKPHRRRKEPPT